MDEDSSRRERCVSRLNLWSRFIYSQEKYVIDGLWQDLPPADNSCTIDLSGGTRQAARAER